MKEIIIIEIPKDMCDNCNSCDKPTSAQIECYLEEPRQVYETVKVPENWEDLRKIASDMCIEKKIDLRFLDDGSFVILLPNEKLIFCSLNSVKKSYYKLLWALEE